MNKEEKKVYNRIYRQAHRIELQAYDRAYNEAHQEEKKTKNQAYYRAHEEKIKAISRNYRLDHLEERRAADLAYIQAHLEQIKVYYHAYQQSHREQYRSRNQKRRALKVGVEHQPYKAEEIYKRDRDFCRLCFKRVAKADRSIDHILPISLGGADAPYNVQLAHKRCNLSKQNTARFPANLKLALL